MIASGIIGALIAAVFGLIDWLGIPEGTRAKYIGLIHGLSKRRCGGFVHRQLVYASA